MPEAGADRGRRGMAVAASLREAFPRDADIGRICCEFEYIGLAGIVPWAGADTGRSGRLSATWDEPCSSVADSGEAVVSREGVREGERVDTSEPTTVFVFAALLVRTWTQRPVPQTLQRYQLQRGFLKLDTLLLQAEFAEFGRDGRASCACAGRWYDLRLNPLAEPGLRLW